MSLTTTEGAGASLAPSDLSVDVTRVLIALDATDDAVRDALACATPDEVAYARGVLDHLIARDHRRLARIDERIDDLRWGLT